jgi:hypothetical protein
MGSEVIWEKVSVGQLHAGGCQIFLEERRVGFDFVRIDISPHKCVWQLSQSFSSVFTAAVRIGVLPQSWYLAISIYFSS